MSHYHEPLWFYWSRTKQSVFYKLSPESADAAVFVSQQTNTQVTQSCSHLLPSSDPT